MALTGSRLDSVPKHRYVLTLRMKELHACSPWLEAELEAVHPEVVVVLGQQQPNRSLARASKSLNRMARSNTLMAFLHHCELHPFAVLRAKTHEDGMQDTKMSVDDLRRATDFLKK